MSRFLTRRFLVAAFVTLIAFVLFKLSFFQENKEAYLFPSIISGGVLLFSLTSLFRETFDLCVDDFEPTSTLHLIPALVLMFTAVFSVEWLGMYVTSSITLFLIIAWYSPQEPISKRLISGLLLTVGFILFMYLLFTIMLGVQLPRGVFI